MLIKLSVLIATVLCLNHIFVRTQIVVYDNLLDLCYWTKTRPLRAPTRCEGNDDIKFERRLYGNTIPYYCIAINNTAGKYLSMIIEYDGEKQFREQDNYFANQVPSYSAYEDAFNLQRDIINMVVSPKNYGLDLQRIKQIKLNNNDQCNASLADVRDRTLGNQENTNYLKFLNICSDVKSRAHRERNKCELLDEVIIEEFKFNNEIRFYCIVIDKNWRKSGYFNDSELIEIQISTTNAVSAFSPKANKKLSESTQTNFRYRFLRKNMLVALFPKNIRADIGQVQSIKVNGVESCDKYVEKPLQACGQLKITNTYLVSYGLSTYQGQFPWHVALFEYDILTKTTRYFCGGSIIGINTILTAAHCLDRGDGQVKVQRIRVQAGLHRMTLPNSNVVTSLVERYIVHREWSKSEGRNDIALLKLETNLVYTNYIQPICFSQDKRKFTEHVGSVVGWGIDETAALSDELKVAPMRVVSHNECRKTTRLVDQSTFCAGFLNGTSACEGDSGGGLVFNFNDGWFLRGIVSLGRAVVGEDLIRRCDGLEYVIFTDAVEYYQWIIEQSAN